MNLQVIARLLSALSVAARNPAFSGAGAVISEVLKVGSKLIEAGEQGAEGLRKLTEEVEAMVRDGRNPSAEEYKALRRRSDAAHAIIQGREKGGS